MAHTAQSAVITNQDSVPVTKVAATVKGGRVRTAYGYLTLAATTAAQTNAFVRVPVRARIISIGLHKASQGNGSVKLGLFRPDDGIAIDDDCLSAAVALTAHTGANVMDAVSVANRAADIATAFSTAISTASATEDAEVDIVASVVTVTTGAATAVGMEVVYVVPD